MTLVLALGLVGQSASAGTDIIFFNGMETRLVSVEIAGPGTVVVGEAVQLTATVTSSGAPVSQAVTWISSNTNLATVDASGLVSGVAAGSATITAISQTDPSARASAEITVLPPVITVAVSGPAEVGSGQTAQLNAVVSSSGGAVSQVVTWTSSNTARATVDSSGLVTGVSAGAVTITATSQADPTASGTQGMTVLPPVITVAVSGPAEVGTGQTAQLSAVVSSSGGAVSQVVTWTSSNTARATVNSSGLVTGVSAGAVTITATAQVDPTAQGARNMTVLAPVVTVAISGGNQVVAGRTVQLSATVTSSGGAISQSVTWLSENASRATVSSTGLVTGVSAGPVVIRATSVAVPTAQGTYTVTVLAPVLTVSISGLSTVQVGKTTQLSADVTSTGGSVSQAVTWTSSNTARATVSATGLVSGIATGAVTITARSQVNSAYAASRNMTVIPRQGRFSAALYWPDNAKYYLFSGAQYYRHSHLGLLDPGYPVDIASNWGPGWPAGWGSGPVDAAEYRTGTGKFYLFKGNQYTSHTAAGVSDGVFNASSWSGWLPAFGSGDLDAMVFYPGNSKWYLFKGSKYIRHSGGLAADSGYPADIATTWSGWPPSWGTGDVDAVVYYPVNNKYYLFKGDEYVRHSPSAGPDSGYPRPIEGNWAVERRLTAVDLLGDLAALSTNTTIQNWDGMDFPADFENRGADGHIQGIAKIDNTWVLSHSRQDYRGVLIYGTNNNWNFRASTPNLGNHPGGIQASGDVVAITYKQGPSGNTNGIKFFRFDAGGYNELTHMRLTTGRGEAVGLAYHGGQERYYLIDAVNATFGSASHPMFRTTKVGASLGDPANSWESIGNMTAFGSAGGMQLMYDDTTQELYLIALYRPEADSNLLESSHAVRVSRLNLQTMTGTQVAFRDNFDITFGLLSTPSFRWGAGLLLDNTTGRVSLVATERCTSFEYTFFNPSNPFPCDPSQDKVDYFILSR